MALPASSREKLSGIHPTGGAQVDPQAARGHMEQPCPALAGVWGYSWGGTAAHTTPAMKTVGTGPTSQSHPHPQPCTNTWPPHTLTGTIHHSNHKQFLKSNKENIWEILNCFSTILTIKHSTTQNTGQLTESLLMAQQLITSILLDER